MNELERCWSNNDILCWCWTAKVIQAEVHDSTEDAVTALRLYYKYKELCDHGAKHLNEEMDRLYEEGRNRGWQIPATDLPTWGCRSLNAVDSLIKK